jgi:hypothetical protein
MAGRAPTNSEPSFSVVSMMMLTRELKSTV